MSASEDDLIYAYRCACGATVRDDDAEAWAALQRAIFDLLGAYTAGQLPTFPKSVAEELHAELGNLLSGRPSTLFSNHAATGGASKDHPYVADAKRGAVLYMRYAKAGYIDDRSPNRTIQQRFGVSDSVVRKWVRQNPQIQAPSVRPSPKEINDVVFNMEVCGDFWEGLPGVRTHSAIRTRSKADKAR